MSKIGVAAVVTTFQAANEILPALESTFDQILKPATVLVVDDGSSDDTVERAHAVAGVDVIALAHSGAVARSRNVALRELDVEYVAFLDVDDRWNPRHLQRAIDLFGVTDASLVCGNAVRVSNAGSAPFFEHLSPSSPYAQTIGEPVGISLRDLIRIRPVVMSSVVVRRADLLAAGGFPEQPEAIASEDLGAWCSLGAMGKTLLFDREPHIEYYEGPESVTRGDREDQGRRATLFVLGELLKDPRLKEQSKEVRIAIVHDQMARLKRMVERREFAAAGRVIASTLASVVGLDSVRRANG